MYNKISLVFILLTISLSIFASKSIPPDFCAVNSSEYKETNFHEVLRLLRIAINQTDNRCAKYFVGLQYHKGNEVPVRLDTALKFYKESAKLNFSHAQYALATMYEYGTARTTYSARQGEEPVMWKTPEVLQDINKATKWYLKAAEQGHINADLRLKNLIYKDTKPFEVYDLANKAMAVQDYNTAFLEWSLLAQKGDSEAQYQLGLMWENSKGVKKSNAGKKWYRESAINGHPKAQYRLALSLLKLHKGLLKSPYKGHAIKWLRLSAKKGNESAKHKLQEIGGSNDLSLNEAVQEFNKDNYKLAFDEFTKLANNGNAKASAYLGLIYEEGSGVNKDQAESFKWYKRSVEQGDFGSASKLAYIYLEQKDHKEAFNWLEKSAKSGDPGAEFRLGLMYDNGPNVKNRVILSYDDIRIKFLTPWEFKYIDTDVVKSEKKAHIWYLKSAVKGNEKAKFALAWQYEHGRGTVSDINKALELYRDMAENGHNPSIRRRNYYEGVDIYGGLKKSISKEKYDQFQDQRVKKGIYVTTINKDKILKKEIDVTTINTTPIVILSKHKEEAIKYLKYQELLDFAIGNYNKKNYEDAFSELLKLSGDKNNVEAQGYLGLTYLFYKDDYAEAIKLLEIATNRGFDFGKLGLAEAYYKLGLSKESNKEAIRWFKKSTEMDFDEAYYQLGNAYLSQGEYEDAIESFEIAVNKGFDSAKTKLAQTYYLLGEYYLFRNSYEKAIKWYFLSENTGYKLSKKLLGRLKDIQRYGGEFSGSGSGFVVSKNGIIATNNHVVKGCKSIWVEGIKAVEIDRNNQVDIALIKVDKKFNNVSSISTKPIELGEEVSVFGFPFSSDLGSEYVTLTKGEVSSIAEVPDLKGSFRFSSPVQPGNSGGPIVNNNGLVIGVARATFAKKEAQNVNIGIRAFNLISMLKNNNIKVSNDSIRSELIIKHYTNVTKYIKCYE